MRVSIYRFFDFFFKIEKHEFWKVQTCFAYFALFGCYWTLSSAIGDTLFLSKFGEDSENMLPWVYIGIAIVTVVVTLIADRLQNNFSKLKLITATQIILSASVFIFWFLIKFEQGWIFYSLVIWLEVCALLTLTFKYAFIGDYFNSREAKRVYAYINGGIAFGGILGGYSVDVLIGFISPENLLILSSILLFGLAMFPLYINRNYKRVATEQEEDEEDSRIPLSTLFKNPYILLILIIPFLQVVYWVLLDYQLKTTAGREMTKLELANFFGAFYAYLAASQLFVQFFLVRLLLTKLGVIGSLFVTPLISLVGGVVFSIYSRFIIIAGANLAYLSFTETLDAPAKQLLYFPLPDRLRLKTQSIAGGVLGPLGQGFGGLLLISLAFIIHKPEHYSIIIAVASFIVVMLVLFVKKSYKETLGQSLQKRQLTPSDLSRILSSSDANTIVSDILSREDRETTLFILNLLSEQNDISRHLPVIQKLTSSQDEQVAAQAIRLLREKGNVSYLQNIERALEDNRAPVLSEAILTYCKFKREYAFDRISPFLTSDKEEVRIAVMTGLAEYSGFYGNLVIFPYLQSLLNSDHQVDRLEATKVIGRIGGFGTGILIKKLLTDSSEKIRMEAIHSSYYVRDPILIPELVQNLQNQNLKDFSIQAIQKMPPEAAENIHNEISNENISTIDQMILIRSLPYIGTQKSVDVLFSILKNNYNIIFLIEITKALDELLSEKNYILNTELLTETREYIYENILLSRKARTEIGKTNEFYAGIYLDHALMNLSVLLNLFSLEYGRKTLRNIQIQLFGNDELLKSNALELLEITLEKKTAEKYMPLFSILIEKELPTGKGLSHETVTEIAQSRNQWLKNVTKCIVEKENKEMPQGVDIDYYEMISRISFLKKVDLFANVPADYLASIVGLLKEKTFYKGEVLFSQGDPGDAFYLIKTGVISVMTNNIEVAELGPGQGIGEMALIEGETRSATAILKEDSELFRLSSSDFNKLLNSYPSITISLLKTISRRLRSRMAKTV